MISINFEEADVVISEKQKQYPTVYAKYNEDEMSIACCFKLSRNEIDIINKTGKIWIKQHLFGEDGKMQPIVLSVIKDDIIV